MENQLETTFDISSEFMGIRWRCNGFLLKKNKKRRGLDPQLIDFSILV